MRARLFGALVLLAASGLLATAPPARAAGETVNIWLTTTDDAAGRHVVRGLQQQPPITFGAGTGTGITVDENTRYQQFVGGGASFTDTAAWLLNSSGALSAATRNSVLTSLFSPTGGIGLSFLRNPMGASDLARFSYPALHAAGLPTKVLALDWNWDAYPDYGSVPVNDATVRNDPNFGGMAWHGYGGDVAMQTTVHDQFPALSAYDTEHSGGTWIANQQQQDMHDIVDYTRNWGRTVTTWSLAVDQDMGPHNGGCGTCTGLVTVHNGDSRSGQADFTVEYYDLGHLTKFVRPGAVRIASTASAAVPNVAWRNPDGSKALIAYNDTATAQPVRVDWGGSSFSYSLPARTTATFTWAGTQAGGTAPAGPITGLAGKCVDVAGAGTTNGTAVQLYSCNGTAAQQWTMAADGSVRALGKCLDVTSAGTADGTTVQLWDCNGSSAQHWTYTAGRDLVNPAADKCLDVTGNVAADATRLQIWTCTGGANQKWTVPA